jgi:hypothetical protein
MAFLAWWRLSESRDETSLEERPATRDLRLEAKGFLPQAKRSSNKVLLLRIIEQLEEEWES